MSRLALIFTLLFTSHVLAAESNSDVELANKNAEALLVHKFFHTTTLSKLRKTAYEAGSMELVAEIDDYLYYGVVAILIHIKDNPGGNLSKVRDAFKRTFDEQHYFHLTWDKEKVEGLKSLENAALLGAFETKHGLIKLN